MKISLENYLSIKTLPYAQRVLRECGFKSPPICENIIADYLDLKIKEFSREDVEHYFNVKLPVIASILGCDVDYIDRQLNNRRNYLRLLKVLTNPGLRCESNEFIIRVFQDDRPDRKRVGIFHEFGHAVLPWHGRFDYSRHNIALTVLRQLEEEAYQCGTELLLPVDMFLEDVSSLEIGFSAIEQLAQRYVATMGLTASWYVSNHPSTCGLIIVVRETGKDHAIHSIGGRNYPLRITDFVKSSRFPERIQPGTWIDQYNPVFETWSSGKRIQEKIPASVFGLSSEYVYNAECFSCRDLLAPDPQMVWVLLWLPDYQLKLDFRKGSLL